MTIQTRAVSAMEYEALLNVEKMVRLAMERPNTGEFLVGALHALDLVRKNEAAELGGQPEPKLTLSAIAVADSLIKRIQKP